MMGEFKSLKYIKKCSNISQYEPLFLPASKGASNCGLLFLCFLFEGYPPYAKPLRPAPHLHQEASHAGYL